MVVAANSLIQARSRAREGAWRERLAPVCACIGLPSVPSLVL
jgi:hypothetical protein